MNSIISSLVVTLVFGVIGWFLFRNVKVPQKWWAWALVILATIAAGYTGTSSILFGSPGFAVHLNDCLQGLGFGAVAGFVIRKK
jgi:hypothetical protein